MEDYDCDDSELYWYAYLRSDDEDEIMEEEDEDLYYAPSLARPRARLRSRSRSPMRFTRNRRLHSPDAFLEGDYRQRDEDSLNAQRPASKVAVPKLSAARSRALHRQKGLDKNKAPVQEDDEEFNETREALRARNLYISNIHPRLDVEALEGLLRRYGTVEECSVHNPNPKAPVKPPLAPDARSGWYKAGVASISDGVRIWALARMSTPDEAAAVVDKLHGKVYNSEGWALRIELGRNQGSKEDFSNMRACNLFLSGIPTHVTEDDLSTLFRQFGPIMDCRVMRDPLTDEPRGFGFVMLLTSAQADAARRGLDGKDIYADEDVGWPAWRLTVKAANRSGALNPTPGRYMGPQSEAQKFKYLPDSEAYPRPSRLKDAAVQLGPKRLGARVERESSPEDEQEAQRENVRRLMEQLPKQVREAEGVESSDEEDGPMITEVNNNTSLDSVINRLQNRKIRFPVTIRLSSNSAVKPVPVSSDALIQVSPQYFARCFNKEDEGFYRFAETVERGFTFFDYPPEVVKVFLYWLELKTIPEVNQCLGVMPSLLDDEAKGRYQILLARAWTFGEDKRVRKLQNAIMKSFLFAIQSHELTVPVLQQMLRYATSGSLLRKAVLEEALWLNKWELLEGLLKTWIFGIDHDISEARRTWESRGRVRGVLQIYLLKV